MRLLRFRPTIKQAQNGGGLFQTLEVAQDAVAVSATISDDVFIPFITFLHERGHSGKHFFCSHAQNTFEKKGQIENGKNVGKKEVLG